MLTYGILWPSELSQNAAVYNNEGGREGGGGTPEAVLKCANLS